MAQIRLEYEYLGIKLIPKKWFNGEVIDSKQESWWYKGSEVIDESKLKNRIKELNSITTYGGSKKYCNIKIG